MPYLSILGIKVFLFKSPVVVRVCPISPVLVRGFPIPPDVDAPYLQFRNVFHLSRVGTWVSCLYSLAKWVSYISNSGTWMSSIVSNVPV